MQMIWHNHVRADPCPMRRTLLTKLQKTFVDSYSSQKFASILCAGCDEVDRRTHEHRIKTTQAVLSIFGGHRPPLQFLRPQWRFGRCRCNQDVDLAALRGPFLEANGLTTDKRGEILRSLARTIAHTKIGHSA